MDRAHREPSFAAPFFGFHCFAPAGTRGQLPLVLEQVREEIVFHLVGVVVQVTSARW